MSQTFDAIVGSAKKQVVHSNVKITPRLAAELLTLNNHSNRPLRQRLVEKYADDMLSENWRFNGDTISVSRTGRLLNGQHRLQAIVQSGRPQLFNIQTGLDDEAFYTIDIGKNRHGGDMLAIKGFSSTNVMAAAIRIIIYYDYGQLHIDTKNKELIDRLRPAEIVKWTEENDADALVEAVREGNALYNRAKFVLTPSLIAAFLYLFGRSNQEKAHEFFNLLITGDGISSSENPSIYLLREKLLAWRNNRVYVSFVERYATIIKAWNLFVKKEKDVKRLKWMAGEDFPTIL